MIEPGYTFDINTQTRRPIREEKSRNFKNPVLWNVIPVETGIQKGLYRNV